MAKQLTFEEAIVKLDEIVNKLEKGEAALDESIALFEEGTKLAALCNKHLNNAEQKVSKVLKLNDEEVESEPFDIF